MVPLAPYVKIPLAHRQEVVAPFIRPHGPLDLPCQPLRTELKGVFPTSSFYINM